MQRQQLLHDLFVDVAEHIDAVVRRRAGEPDGDADLFGFEAGAIEDGEDGVEAAEGFRIGLGRQIGIANPCVDGAKGIGDVEIIMHGAGELSLDLFGA